MPLVARNPVIRNSGANVSVYTSSQDKKHLCPPRKFLIREIVVRSHNNSRLFMTEWTLEMRQP
jgi:hypothetical protein